MATRDYELAQQKDYLIYNPFWGYLKHNFCNEKPHGSHYFKGGNITKWFTLDQVFFSHGLVKGTDWRMSKSFEHIVNIPGLIEEIKDRKSIFDHFPVSGKIEKV